MLWRVFSKLCASSWQTWSWSKDLENFTSNSSMPRLPRKLTKAEKKVFKAKLDSIETRKFGCGANCCNRVRHAKQKYRINGKTYTAAQLSWIVGTGRHLPADGLDIDHICADPKWTKKCCKCITFEHLRRKDRLGNLSRKPCHYIIRIFKEKLYPSLRKDPSFKLKIPGPIYISDVLPYISELHDIVHYQRIKATVWTESEANKAAKKKADWIKNHSICSRQHADDPCLICYGQIFD